jgi:metal-responsive CopG/Arc/MetJ family transcriptional regulator
MNEFSNIIIQLPKELKLKFKSVVAINGELMSEVIRNFIIDYVKKALDKGR